MTARATRADDPWWRTAVVYQVYPRSFADSDGDGIGDLRGIIDRLDHLVDLGIDVLWLSPIYPSPQDDNGYDISDYRDVDPVFGDLATLDELIDQVHRRGMRIILDLVVNHTSDEHPWFIESRSSTRSPKRDWYWWRPPRVGFTGGEDGAEPTNWEGFFSGSTWEYDPASEEYYLHLFSRKQPDLNWEHPEVRAAIHDMMRWWLDRGVDGFRMDVINLVSKDVSLPDAPLADGRHLGDGSPAYISGPRIHEFLQEMHREVFADRPDRWLAVGEMPGVSIEDAADFTDPARHELDMVFQFEHVGADHGPGGKWESGGGTLRDVIDVLVRWQEGLADRGWNSLYWNNHDQPRVVSRFGDQVHHWRESATALATVLHLQRGTPFVYQGEEIGMTNTPFASVDDLRDIESLRFLDDAVGLSPDDALARVHRMGRDNARTPMQWEPSAGAGFSTGDPWIGVPTDRVGISVAEQREEPRSVLAHYRQLIALRHDEPLVTDGRFRRIPTHAADLLVYLREGEHGALIVIANLSSESVTVDESVAFLIDETPDGEWKVVLSNMEPGSWTQQLRPWEAVVARRGCTGDDGAA